jgi:hypothetical protein
MSSMTSLLMVVAASGVAGGQAAPTPPPAAVQPVAPFVEADGRAAVEALASALSDSFVFPEVGHRYAAALRAKLASGGYARFDNAEAFAKAVTDDLQAIHKDGHLRLFAPDPAATAERPRRLGPQPEDAIGKSGWLADGVAYIDFRGFPGDPATLQRLRAFLDQHAGCEDADHRRASPWRRRPRRNGPDVPALLWRETDPCADGHAVGGGRTSRQSAARGADPGPGGWTQGGRSPLAPRHSSRPGEWLAHGQESFC